MVVSNRNRNYLFGIVFDKPRNLQELFKVSSNDTFKNNTNFCDCACVDGSCQFLFTASKAKVVL